MEEYQKSDPWSFGVQDNQDEEKKENRAQVRQELHQKEEGGKKEIRKMVEQQGEEGRLLGRKEISEEVIREEKDGEEKEGGRGIKKAQG